MDVNLCNGIGPGTLYQETLDQCPAAQGPRYGDSPSRAWGTGEVTET